MTFKTIEKEIIPILEQNVEARANDMILYAEYVNVKTPWGNSWDNILAMVFTNPQYRITNGIAPYESVARIRRKVQEIRRDLRPTPAQLEEKYRAEKEYRKYAKGVKE